MSERPSSVHGESSRAASDVPSTRTVALAWAGLALAWLCFDLPTMLRSGGFEPGAVRISLDVLALLTGWGATVIAPRAWPLRPLLGAVAVCLFAYRVDQLIFTFLMREEPLLYDQWFMLRHLVVLVHDLMSLGALFAVAGVLLGLGLLSWLLARALGRARVLLAPSRRSRTFTVVAALWAIGLTVAHVPRPLGSEPKAHWLTLAIADNLERSLATYRSIQGGVADSPYQRYDALALRDKPDVLLFIVESYGRILMTDPGMRDAHAALLARLEDELSGAGWRMASAFSRSSVSGGRSWIAEGTMLMGTPIRYEAVFHHLLSHARGTPNLVSFLARQGYETVLLAPADRNRAGLSIENRYGFDRILHHETLDYRGPPVGWGIVPDAFSLAFAQKAVLDERDRPLFLDFHMVTSHAPWVVPPELSGATKEGAALSADRDREERGKSALTLAVRRLRLYERDDDDRYTYKNALITDMRAGYQVTIRYDLELIVSYLRTRARDALVLVLGDHQPPVITGPRESFDTPLHVLSRDPRRIEALRELGFVEGLRIADRAPAALAHAGFFSTVVRALSATSYPPSELPPVLSEGTQLLP